jgi:hypothetical protein
MHSGEAGNLLRRRTGRGLVGDTDIAAASETPIRLAPDGLLRPTVGEVPLSRRLRSVPRIHTADGNASA